MKGSLGIWRWVVKLDSSRMLYQMAYVNQGLLDANWETAQGYRGITLGSPKECHVTSLMKACGTLVIITSVKFMYRKYVSSYVLMLKTVFSRPCS